MSHSPSGAFRRLLPWSLAFSAGIIAVGALLFSAVPADAAAYSITNSSGPLNWTDSTKWGCAPGPCTYPGAAPGDTATLGLSGPYVMVVNSAIPNAVTSVSITCAGCAIDVQAGGSIGVGGGTIANLAGFNVSGGNLQVQGGTLTFNGSAKLNLSAGTVDNDGQIDFNNTSALEWTGEL